MQLIRGVFILLLFLLLGEGCSILIGGFVPGNVLGMLFLFLALTFRLVKLADVKPIADVLTKNMVLFFVPASIGLMDQIGFISHFWLGFLAICLITTLVVVVAVGWLQQFQLARLERKRALLQSKRKLEQTLNPQNLES